MPVEVVTLASGHERRNRRVAEMRRRYTLPGTTRPIEEAQLLASFFNSVDGQSQSFQFRDPIWNTTATVGQSMSMLDITLGTGDGSTSIFPWPTEGEFRRVLPEIATLEIAVDGNLTAPSAVIWNVEQRQLEFTDPPANGALVTCGCAFRVQVRFGTDALSISTTHNGAAMHEDVILQEVFE